MAGSEMADERLDRQATLGAAIMRLWPEVRTVEFDEDGEHVLIGPIEIGGERIFERYRLGAEAHRFLLGELPLDELPDDLSVLFDATEEEAD